jgi:hypothetical protein
MRPSGENATIGQSGVALRSANLAVRGEAELEEIGSAVEKAGHDFEPSPGADHATD